MLDLIDELEKSGGESIKPTQDSNPGSGYLTPTPPRRHRVILLINFKFSCIILLVCYYYYHLKTKCFSPNQDLGRQLQMIVLENLMLAVFYYAYERCHMKWEHPNSMNVNEDSLLWEG